MFKSPNFRLAVLNSLLEAGVFESEIKILWKKIDDGDFDAYFENCTEEEYMGAQPEVLKYLNALPITEQHLSEVTSLSFEVGNEIYGLIAPNWEGADDLFTVTSLEDVALLPNLKALLDSSLLKITNAAPLLSVQKLERVDCGFGISIRDPNTIGLLKEKGVTMLNEKIGEQSSDNDAATDYSSNGTAIMTLDRNDEFDDQYENQFEDAVDLIWAQDEPEAGLNILEKLLRKNPQDAYVWLEKGNALDALDRTKEAEQAWLKALELEPNFYEALYGMANAKMKASKYSEALEYINKALDCDPEELASPLHIQAQLYAFLGDKKKSVETFEEVLILYSEQHEEDPEDVEPLFQIACVHAALGNEKDALKFLKRVLAEDPDYAQLALEDSDFEKLKNNPEFKKLTRL